MNIHTTTLHKIYKPVLPPTVFLTTFTPTIQKAGPTNTPTPPGLTIKNEYNATNGTLKKVIDKSTNTAIYEPGTYNARGQMLHYAMNNKSLYTTLGYNDFGLPTYRMTGNNYPNSPNIQYPAYIAGYLHALKSGDLVKASSCFNTLIGLQNEGVEYYYNPALDNYLFEGSHPISGFNISFHKATIIENEKFRL